jgi:hypothetical protein
VHAKEVNPTDPGDVRDVGDQRAEALTQANHVRMRRAALKRRLKSGDESLAQLILDPPDFLRTSRVEVLIMAAPGFGKVKSNTLLREVGILPRTVVGRLTDRQRTGLAAKLRTSTSSRVAASRLRLGMGDPALLIQRDQWRPAPDPESRSSRAGSGPVTAS